MAISTSKTLLVPYCEHHVSTYHRWMQDQELQNLTASEPLTLEEEHTMQRSWQTDRDKLTFIICLHSAASRETGEDMIGDVNLFLTNGGGRDGDEGVVGEVELMIAEEDMRGKGLGRAGLLAFLKFVTEHLEEILKEFQGGEKGEEEGLEYMRVRISEGNIKSIRLFESLGFQKIREEPNFFGEVELRTRGLTVARVDALLERYSIAGYQEIEYRGRLGSV
ncbi:hypothetical protein FGG08_003356 [Glutinoglossum americanum]|uniref:N-acetyltransferase domain-containing protein n=1 Tax=Glutinoglossum americanum TaxID=1670608 RepID=A0A9P8L0Q5_9PEZI|nr:hypothetical protein FGG08_003356 [Glutinoglossum americanum]